jgi:hypothetical protein
MREKYKIQESVIYGWQKEKAHKHETYLQNWQELYKRRNVTYCIMQQFAAR